ncbi:type IV secretory system conjugative DNA transfer family protein [Jannaschia aquimarina]|uniref:TraG_1 protein n=1 Tax=Jannaschia aquimarina TaxID=935700 RepID=A0A0D1EKW4_9RHOB|nr:type IV secretory system conjugative DNA transfer family protein [Jannaschia aquimarina]KIT16375.1 Conjugal transfer protein TraG [Jannaschia aquimarina]SNT05086.1 type IV secretion system protein VirD4 [Jannaschia aquimarina]
MAGKDDKNGSVIGGLLIGGSFFAMAAIYPDIFGTPLDAGDNFRIGVMQTFGGLGLFSAAMAGYGRFLRGVSRLEALKPSGIYGNAEFADLAECTEKGLTDPSGLYLGLLDGVPLFFNGRAHLFLDAPARSGKSAGVVTGNLLHYQSSVVVTDPKGELAAMTAAHRRKRFGQDVVIFSPWKLHGLPCHRINPLENVIALAGDPALRRGLTDEVKSIVMQLYPEPEDTRNRYFRDGSRSIMRAVLLYLALHAPKRCTLPEMWRLIANPLRLERAVEAMRKSEELGGILADLGDDLASQMRDNADLFGDFRAGAIQQLDIFEPGGYLADAVSGSDVALADLKSGKVSFYLAFPTDRIASHGAALGLIVNQAISAVARSPEKGEVLFLLDEFANLGKLSGLAESLTALPGLGVRVWIIVQELAELVRLYGPNTTETILSQAEVKQFFAVNSDQLAQKLSRALGQKTVKTLSFNLGRTDDDDIGESLGETGQPLMRPEEIKQMGADQQLLLVNGVRPILGERMPFWFVAPWREWASVNPVEGDCPDVKPRLRLDYAKKE